MCDPNCDCGEEVEQQQRARRAFQQQRAQAAVDAADAAAEAAARAAAAEEPYTTKHYLAAIAMMLAMLAGFFKSIDQDTAHNILATVGLGFLIPPKPKKGLCIRPEIRRWPPPKEKL